MNRLLVDRRIVLCAMVCVAIAIAFWSGSRYPALNEKALMGGTTVLEDPLGFEALVPIDPADPLLWRIGATTINWLSTNRQGMTFGLLLAAAFMSLVRLLSDFTLRGSFANSLAGVALGAPLGVCVNCAAPIARGLHGAGARLETSLAAMISSPTLNVVVLAMLISLFPLYMVVIKLSLSVLFMLVGIPLLTRFAFGNVELTGNAANRMGERPEVVPLTMHNAGPAERSWLPAFKWVLSDYATNLWFIVRRTVPLMLLAGLIGSATMSLLPWELIVDWLPRTGEVAIAVATTAVALLGLILPVPIAFDVVVCAGMLSAGVPPEYVMALLFSLGIFSIYSFSVVWESVSLRVAATLSIALLGLTLGGSAIAFFYDSYSGESQRAVFEQFALESHSAVAFERPDRATAAPRDRVPLAWQSVVAPAAPGSIALERRAFTAPSPGPAPESPSSGRFERWVGDDVGLLRDDKIPFAYKLTTPWYRNTPVSAGDFDRDGRVDLLFGSRGLQLYANIDGRHFEAVPIEVPDLDFVFASNAALVDLDSDGWLDIFVSVYRGGNHVIYNDRGRYHAGRHVKLPDTGANLANSMGFGDPDRDGDLDIALGNWTSGGGTRWPPEASRNVIAWNRGESFELEPLPYLPAETLSALFSDIDHDGDLDLLFGNDFGPADAYYLGDGGGGFARVKRSDDLVSSTTFSTMSFDTADLDNDLRLEIYSSQITGGAPGQRERLSFREVAETCDEYPDGRWREHCEQSASMQMIFRQARDRRNPEICDRISNREERGACLALLMAQFASDRGERGLCDKIPARWEDLAFACHTSFIDRESYPDLRDEGLRQLRNRNALLQWDGSQFAEISERMGVDLGGWAWNARFADIDHDGWQDLFIANGRAINRDRVSNVLYRNRDGERFEDATGELGLLNHMSTAAYVYADLDNDGDLDIVLPTIDGPVFVYENRAARGNAIQFELSDRVGNRDGIGSQIIIHYGDGATLHQLRELKASGGFVSFDPASAHFGLARHANVARVEILWSTGERTELNGPFEHGHRYRVTRTAR